MNKRLEYPFDGQFLLRNRRKIRRELLSGGTFIEKNVAILGGSTTHDIRDMLELFLLNNGIRPNFFESEYAQYWQDAMFGNDELDALKPDVIFIHTSNRNLNIVTPQETRSKLIKLLQEQFEHFGVMWDKLTDKYHCPIIQNNFEYPYYRLLGNRDASDFRGRVNFITRLNLMFYDYADSHENFFINDINYQSSDYGLSRWSDPFYWHMYKYALCLDAIPVLAFNVANIIKSIFGKNKKAVALDLDNTLWGGVVGDDGVENLELGQETSMGQAYSEFQGYLKSLHDRGILLNIISKNDNKNAVDGLNHPQMILKPDDFISIKANWEPKSQNLIQMAKELSLLPESFVFVDDNPAERAIVEQNVPGVAVPALDRVEHYIAAIDKAGYFEATTISDDDLKRNEMYEENLKRAELQSTFTDYHAYLLSLKMSAEIAAFTKVYMSRIAQLTNKSNQFNLTTKRYSQEDIETIANSSEYITLYGKLEDRFGDNGVVSVVIAHINGSELDIMLWLMSCRVLKRDMEFAMMDELVRRASKLGIKIINGYYFSTAKNGMVRDFYSQHGFKKISENDNGDAKWSINVSDYKNKNTVIKIIGDDER